MGYPAVGTGTDKGKTTAPARLRRPAVRLSPPRTLHSSANVRAIATEGGVTEGKMTHPIACILGDFFLKLAEICVSFDLDVQVSLAEVRWQVVAGSNTITMTTQSELRPVSLRTSASVIFAEFSIDAFRLLTSTA